MKMLKKNCHKIFGSHQLVKSNPPFRDRVKEHFNFYIPYLLMYLLSGSILICARIQYQMLDLINDLLFTLASLISQYIYFLEAYSK